MSNIPQKEPVFIALGGNIGKREAYLQTGLDELKKFCDIVRCSSFINTAPLGGEPGQPDYLNAVVQIETNLPPLKLLQEMLAAEKRIGRIRDGSEKRWGPRVIDLDLLLYGQRIINEPPHLQLPHPRMHEREFVLAPLCEIAPDTLHPIQKKTAQQLLKLLHGT